MTMNELIGIDEKDGIQAQGDMDHEKACREKKICHGNKESMPSDIFLSNLNHFFNYFNLTSKN
jgi:hypothetical protein